MLILSKAKQKFFAYPFPVVWVLSEFRGVLEAKLKKLQEVSSLFGWELNVGSRIFKYLIKCAMGNLKI